MIAFCFVFSLGHALEVKWRSLRSLPYLIWGLFLSHLTNKRLKLTLFGGKRWLVAASLLFPNKKTKTVRKANNDANAAVPSSLLVKCFTSLDQTSQTLRGWRSAYVLVLEIIIWLQIKRGE